MTQFRIRDLMIRIPSSPEIGAIDPVGACFPCTDVTIPCTNCTNCSACTNVTCNINCTNCKSTISMPEANEINDFEDLVRLKGQLQNYLEELGAREESLAAELEPKTLEDVEVLENKLHEALEHLAELRGRIA